MITDQGIVVIITDDEMIGIMMMKEDRGSTIAEIIGMTTTDHRGMADTIIMDEERAVYGKI